MTSGKECDGHCFDMASETVSQMNGAQARASQGTYGAFNLVLGQHCGSK